MVRARSGDEPLKTVNNFEFSADELHEVVDALAAAKTVERRLKVPGLDERRADIILGGAIILDEAFRALGITAMRVSDFALREGVLLDALARRERMAVGHLADLRRRSVEHLAAIAPGERAHSEHAARLALELFAATRERHGLGDEAAELLEAAALLANVGLFISSARHHLHSFYIIRNSDLLMGFTDHEIDLIAQIARYHRKSTPKARHPEFARLHPDDQHLVRVLAGILRVAIALDRSRRGVVRHLELGAAGGGGGKQPLVIEVDSDGADPSLELYTVEDRKALLEEALGTSVRIVARGTLTFHTDSI
jgi:exopolyphosphatase/guanosine-5'-triphosphate,3'-diphosphate pyrophosphatase